MKALSSVAVAATVAATAFAGVLVGPATPAEAAPSGPAWTCDANGYLIQTAGGGAHQIYQVDLVSGASRLFDTTTGGLNAVGYNTTDNYMYGHDNDIHHLVEIASDGEETALPDPAGFTEAAYNVGDFDNAGHLWITTNGTGEKWYEIDYAAGSPTYGQILATGNTGVNIATGNDWAYVNGALYSLSVNGNLTKFDTTTHVTTNLGPLSGVPGDIYGGAYADAAGNLYFSSNDSGEIYRVNPTTLGVVDLATGPTAGNNDGARCAAAPIPTITVTKTVNGRAAAADQFTVGLDQGTNTLTSATTTGTNTTASTINWPVTQRTTYTITDAMAAGPDTMAAYAQSIACTDSTGAKVKTGGSPGAWTIAPPGTDAYTCAVTNTANSSAISIVKHAAAPVDVNGDGLVDAGDTIQYTFTVTNSGTTTLSAVGVTDDKAGEVTCPQTTLPGSAQEVCTADSPYTITAADVAHGSVDNSATAQGTPTGAPQITSTPSTTSTPTAAAIAGVVVVKTSTATSITSAGQNVPYSFHVTNSGNVSLTNVGVSDIDFSGTGTLSAVSCPQTTLAAAEVEDCSATYTTTQADVNAGGNLTNTATASGIAPGGATVVSGPSTVAIPVAQNSSLTVVKSSDTATIAAAGQQVTYSFLLTNTGNTTLADVSPTETAFSGSGSVSDPSCPEGAASLAPGVAVTCTATYAVTQADIDKGADVTNTAVGTALTPSGTPITSGPSQVSIPVAQTPGLSILKTASPTGESAYKVNEVITYSFAITNTGNTTLTDVSPEESAFSGSGFLSPIDCPATAASIAPASVVICTANYTVTQADVDAGNLTNTAIATGTPPGGNPIPSNPSTVELPIPQTPSLAIVKTAQLPSITAAGQAVDYTLAVTNTGNVTLTNVAPVEGAFTGSGPLSDVTCPAGPVTLAPSDVETCTATYTATQADIDAGTDVDNTATATATAPGGVTVAAAPSTAVVPVVQTNALTVVKASDTVSITAAGQKIAYSFLLTNSGNTTLTDVAPVEGDFNGSGPLSDPACSSAAASLAPGAAVTCTATYTTSQADVDKGGNLTNTATGIATAPEATPVTSGPSTVSIPIDQAPALSIVKTSSQDAITAANEDVPYTFVVTNNGNVTLTDVTPVEGDFSGTGTVSDPVCPAAADSVAPGDAVTCTATYSTTQADVDAGGDLTNSAIGTGVAPDGSTVPSQPSTVSIPVDQTPGLSIVKSVTPEGEASYKAGEVFIYSFAITNTGNVTETDVKPVEGDFTGSGTLAEPVCPDAAASVAPGATVTCTASYTVTQADVDAGSITNAATADGTNPQGGDTPSNPSTVTVPDQQHPALTLLKTDNVTDITSVGQAVTYAFKITNTGDVTEKNVKPSEGVFSGTGALPTPVCPAGAASLAPGDSVTCTTVYHVTSADLMSGQLINTATAVGTQPNGDPEGSPLSTAKVPAVAPAPVLAFTGSAGVKAGALGALALLAIGGVLLVLRRRRRA